MKKSFFPSLKRLLKRASALLLLLLPALAGCGKAEPYVQTGFAFDTVVSITYYDEKDAAAAAKVMERLDHYEKIFSRTLEGSELYGVNARLAEAASEGVYDVRVPLSNELYQALYFALEYAEITDGAFDPTLGKLLELYDFSGTEHTVPSAKVREEILSHCGWQKLKLSASGETAYPYQLTVADPGIVIDLGGMAKGYTADCLKQELRAENVSSAIINLGGNILVLGSKPGGKPYKVGVTEPVSGSSKYLTTFSISDASAVTSGSYQGSFEQDGVTYHHILDPATGLPADSGLKSVTVVAGRAVVADILSTALFVMGEDKAIEFYLENCTNIDLYFVDKDGILDEILHE